MVDFLSLSEVKELLQKEKEERGELSPEQGYALQHSEAFARLTPKKTQKLAKSLLEMEFISPQNAVKLGDLLPTHPEEVRSVFAKERFILSKEDIERILTTIARFL